MKDTTAIEIKDVVEGVTTFSIKPRETGKKKKLKGLFLIRLLQK